MEPVRLRLVFKDSHILNELQKFEGFQHSWFLLKPQHKTISDLSSYVLETFQLQHSCPHGLLLSIDGFVLPPFESTCIFKDKDVISVEKKGAVLAIQGNHAPNIAENIDIVEKQPVNTGILLLANEEFDNESGGYESEESEDESEDEEGADPVQDSSHLEKSLGGNAISKKRKASETLPSLEKKIHCSEVAEKVDEQTKKSQQDLTSKKSLCKQKKVPNPDNKDVDNNKESAESSRINDNISDMKENNKLQENGVDIAEASPKPEGGRKHGPSRSARRKKQKRRWLREILKIQKKNAASESEGLRNWKELQASAGKGDGNLHSKCPVNGETDGRPKGRRNWKQQQNEAKNQEGTGQPKGLLHWKQWREESKGTDPNRQVLINGKSTLCEKPGQDSDMGDEVVQVETRPGHIRFEPLAEDQAVQQDQVQSGSSGWNLTACNGKGQKWGQEKISCSFRNNSVNSNKEHSEMINADRGAHFKGSIDFKTLPYLTGQAKEGHVIAYRLLELSSTWTAELSSYRVGKVSRYNPEEDRVLLTPVAEYPVFSSEGECSMHRDNSIYKEDGSLEIDFSSLLEVRLVKNGTSDSVAGLSVQPSEDPATIESNLGTSEKKTDAAAIVNGRGNLWEQFSETPMAKKGELHEESSWGKWSSGKSSWSQRALRGGAQCSRPYNGPSMGQSSGESSWGKGSFGKTLWSHRALRGGAHCSGPYNGPSKGQLSEESNWGKGSSGQNSWSHRALRGGAHCSGSYSAPSKGQLSEESSQGKGISGQSSWSQRALRGGANCSGSYNGPSKGQLSEENSGGKGSAGRGSWSRRPFRGGATRSYNGRSKMQKWNMG